MRCGNWLVRLLRRLLRVEGRSEDPRELTPGEVVARILYTKSHFSRERKRPKPGAFNPSPYTELSGIHVTGLADPVIWEIARNTMRDHPGRNTIYARADVPVKQFLEQKLRAVLDDKPFKRHASVVGWPIIADQDQRKERWKEICLALSESPQVQLVLPQTPVVLRE